MNASMRKISYSNFVNHLGFTLVELMVTVVVLGIIASIAAPNISNQLANQRVKSTTVTLMSVLKEARAESNINRIPLTVSYDNGNQSNNFINVKAPYAGPAVFAYSTRAFDWTNLFLKSAQADMSVPKNPPGNNQGGNNQGGNNQGGNNQGGNNQGGNNQGGNNQGGNNQGGNNQGGNNQGGNNQGGNNQGGNNQGGNNQGGNNQGGNNQSGNNQGDNNQGGNNQGGNNQGGNNQGGNNQGGNGETTDGETTEGVDPNLVIIATYQYDKKVVIKSSPEKITFKPNRTVDTPMTYTICHSNKSVSPQQVNVSKNGLISSNIGGSC